MQVFVTPNAEEDFESIVQQIRKHWGERVAKQFLTKADKVFNLLQKFPAMGPIESGDIRGFQLSPQTLLWRAFVTRALDQRSSRDGLGFTTDSQIETHRSFMVVVGSEYCARL